MTHWGRTTTVLLTVTLATAFCVPTQAGGAYSWDSVQFDCQAGTVGAELVIAKGACEVWDLADVPSDSNHAFGNSGTSAGGCVANALGGYTCEERYETALGGDHIVVAFLHHPRAADGTYNVGGVFWHGALSDDHEGRGGTTLLDLPEGLWKVRVTIIDDEGGRIGGFFCTDNDVDDLCAENEGELAQAVCGSSNIFKPMDSTQIARAVVFVDGPTFQTMDCPGSEDYLGGTSGVIRLDLVPA